MKAAACLAVSAASKHPHRDFRFDEDLADRVRLILSNESTAVEERMSGGLAFLVACHLCCGAVGEDHIARVGADQNARFRTTALSQRI